MTLITHHTEMPNHRMTNFSSDDLTRYIIDLSKRNSNNGGYFGSKTVTALTANAYIGGVYSPTQDRIYFVPYGVSSSGVLTWHYIDCATGILTSYSTVISLVSGAGRYFGGVYSPTQNRIYFIPYTIYSQTDWHYIDCNTGLVVAYQHSGVNPQSNPFRGGVYSPTQNRIYFVPYGQGASSQWFYIDCDTGVVTIYSSINFYVPGSITSTSAYIGGVYSPTQNRIYFIPYGQSNQANWHYIDCATGLPVAYLHGSNATNSAFQGGVYSPTQNRIYFVPNATTQTDWHYIDCNTGNVVAYQHPGYTGVSANFSGGVYSPTQNRIYFVPYSVSANGCYIDCNTGTAVSYSLLGNTYVSLAYQGGVYSPSQNRIYFIPYVQSAQTSWHYIQEFNSDNCAPHLASLTMFNKF